MFYLTFIKTGVLVRRTTTRGKWQAAQTVELSDVAERVRYGDYTKEELRIQKEKFLLEGYLMMRFAKNY